MKILVTRRVNVLAVFKPEEIRADWLTEPFVCDECGCKFQLEPEDRDQISARLVEVDGGHVGVNDFLEYIVFCPGGCGRTVKVGGSAFPTPEDYKHVPNKYRTQGVQGKTGQ